MARYFKTWAIGCLLLAVGMLTACQEGGEAGDLHGQWRLTGSDIHYMSFSGSIAQFRDASTGYQVFGNFQHVGDSLFIQCYSIEGDPIDITVVEETFGFKPFNNIRVKIAAIGSDDLVLTKGERTWSFYKW
jgi:hypothetical protein